MSRFVGIQSLVTRDEAVIGENAWTSDAATAEAAATDIASRAKFNGEVTVTPHQKNAYQHNVSVDGTLRFRLLNVETAPKRKVPTGI